MKYNPHPYQEYAGRRIVEGGNVGLFLSMGLGKSVITLTAVDELIYDRLEVSRVLVIAPKKVAEATWQAEILKWDHLKRLTFATALGSVRQREEAIRAEADITIINRENVVWLAEAYGGRWPWDMVVVDESSSFKNPGAKRFKALKRILARSVAERPTEGRAEPASAAKQDAGETRGQADGAARGAVRQKRKVRPD